MQTEMVEVSRQVFERVDPSGILIRGAVIDYAYNLRVDGDGAMLLPCMRRCAAVIAGLFAQGGKGAS